MYFRPPTERSFVTAAKETDTALIVRASRLGKKLLKEGRSKTLGGHGVLNREQMPFYVHLLLIVIPISGQEDSMVMVMGRS